MDYRFIGWCREGTSDKVWGVINLDKTSSVVFWGRRGKKLQTKIDSDSWELNKLIRAKEKKGYVKVDKDHLDRVYPEFENDLQATTVWALLSV
jgi:predicted DNA-binding WGR domain protein